MTTIVLALKRNGDLYSVGATEDVEIVLITETERVRKLKVETMDLKGMESQDLQAATCDHLSYELQTGRLDLVELNNALRLE